MKSNGYSEEAIKALWDVMLPFSGMRSTSPTPPATVSSPTGLPI